MISFELINSCYEVQHKFTQICGCCTISKVGEHARLSFPASIKKLSWLLKQILRENAQLCEIDGVAGCKTEQEAQSTCVPDYILVRGRRAEPGPCSWPAVRREDSLQRRGSKFISCCIFLHGSYIVPYLVW